LWNGSSTYAIFRNLCFYAFWWLKTLDLQCHAVLAVISTMLAAEIIRKKRDGGALSADELAGFIGGYVTGEIPDYQVSALLMAIFFRGMSPQETAALTRTMMTSGRTYHLKSERPLIDKHSTGGMGDKVSLVLAPLAAACGLAVPMVSGRGLGHTGGTLDKLESIPGFNVHLTPDQFTSQIQDLGIAMIGQSDDFVPADKKLYALRDVSGTVECIPLLCSSILSKKAASGARGVVMDVKCGSGAFMSDIDGARALARGLVTTGRALDLPVRCLITDMNQPLGRSIGNANEMRESIDCLKGGGPIDLRELTLELTAEMLLLGGLEADLRMARIRATEALDGGTALEIFGKMIAAQGGDCSVIDNPDLLPIARESLEIHAEAEGYLDIINCRDFGLAALVLGAGRRKSSDSVDPAVGLISHQKTGDKINKGDLLFTVDHNGVGVDECRQYLSGAIRIIPDVPATQPLVIERMS
jgi:pyrimidine-nucleoside phosphorylase/thymidine phosphorylase